MRKPLTIAAISAALVITPLAAAAPAQAASVLPSLKQLKISGSWRQATDADFATTAGGVNSLCPMGQSCAVKMWLKPGGEIATYAQVSAGRTSSGAATLALAAQLQQADSAVAQPMGPFVWRKQSTKGGPFAKKNVKIWTGKLVYSGVPIEHATVVVSGKRIAAFYSYGATVYMYPPKKAIAGLVKVVTSKKTLPTLSGTPRGFIGALNDNLSETG